MGQGGEGGSLQDGGSWGLTSELEAEKRYGLLTEPKFQKSDFADGAF